MIDLGDSAYVPFGRFRNRIEVFDIIPGTRQLTIPTGWTKIRVAVVGGGGGGRRVSNASNHGLGGGGGGGGYAEIKLNVVAGQTYTYTVGAGGDLSQDGGTTSFGGILSATGGRTATDNTTVASKGGAGGVGIGGSINTSGGIGGNGFDGNKGGGGGGGASGNRYGNGGAGGAGLAYADGVFGGAGGSWENYPRPLLYDDGWGLGITPHDKPLDAELYVEYLGSGNAINVYYSRVGEGTSDNYNMVNIGGGSCARCSYYENGVKRGGIGGGAGGGGDTYATGRGGQGAVIVEVLS